MTKTIFWISTLTFWLAVCGLWAGSLWVPSTQDDIAKAAERRIEKSEIARHSTADDCWMSIRGQVYDFSAYISSHPTRPEVITDWCGKEATHAFDTKMQGRPHSPYAIELLAKYRLGAL